jgi:hypothetical protein
VINSQISARVVKVNETLNQQLTLPVYQRPYRWQEENVKQLLQDIAIAWQSPGKRVFRIGAIILHDDGTHLNIVDGQQRITTLLLILKALACATGSQLRQSLPCREEQSKNCVALNYRFIKDWLADNALQFDSDFTAYIERNCEFVEIRVNNLSEAFQMFDSQNGKGKGLQPYNLLKAYHIRAMDHEPDLTIKVECDIQWESLTRHEMSNGELMDLLGQVLGEQLYRTRLFCRKDIAHDFTKAEIDEFKGFTVSKQPEFPYQNKLRILAQTLDQALFARGALQGSLPAKERYPFSICQPMINGRYFFSYVRAYCEAYDLLFIEHSRHADLDEFRIFYQNLCFYPGWHRDGDSFLRELFKSVILLVFDRFGIKGVAGYHKIFYALVYRLRLEKVQVRYNSVAEYAMQSGIFAAVENAKHMSDLRALMKQARNPIDCRKDVEQVIRFFLDFQVNLTSNENRVNLSNYTQPDL